METTSAPAAVIGAAAATEVATYHQQSSLASLGSGPLRAPAPIFLQIPQHTQTMPSFDAPGGAPVYPHHPHPVDSHHQPRPARPPFFLHPSPRPLPLKHATPSPSFPPNNKDLKDLMPPDDTFFTVNYRKVRISDGGSVYALCRSWLRNGYPEQSQPQYGDALKSLPRPLPMPESASSKIKESDDETESDEDERAVEVLGTEELLRGHIKRAKRIRERLREERLQRIKRYKSRLSLLLPPPVEQSQNDLSNGT